MTDEEINVAIAEACGWRKEDGVYMWEANGIDCTYPELWDWCNDLNAMHVAEESLFTDNQKLRWKYVSELHITAEPTRWGNYAGAHATARQRAEAFLRTIGRWG